MKGSLGEFQFCAFGMKGIFGRVSDLRFWREGGRWESFRSALLADPSAALWNPRRKRWKNGESDETGFYPVVSPSTLYLRQVSRRRPPHRVVRSSLALQFLGDKSVRGAGDETLGKR